MKKFFEIDEVKTVESMEVQFPEHAVMLNFNGDIQAEAFLDWWNKKGLNAFTKWTEKHGAKYS